MRVLAVDDHEDSARALAKALELHGFDVCIAFDVASAMNTAFAFRPDVILLDICMPGVSGIDAARLIRLLPNFDEVELIAITGVGEGAVQDEMRAAGVELIFPKPCDYPRLCALLDAICARRSADGMLST